MCEAVWGLGRVEARLTATVSQLAEEQVIANPREMLQQGAVWIKEGYCCSILEGAKDAE